MTSAKRKEMLKTWRKVQQTSQLSLNVLDDTIFEIVANATIAKQTWKVLQELKVKCYNYQKTGHYVRNYWISTKKVKENANLMIEKKERTHSTTVV